MAWADEDLIPISALQHYVYCARQCALIHVEQTFEENLFTLRGHRAHERVERGDHEVASGQRVEYALPLWSERLGLTGRADAVFFQSDGTPYPVEHKVGRRKDRLADDVQLCAQALCLEEMFDAQVSSGAIFYGTSRRRREVPIDASLRAKTENVVNEVRALLSSKRLPPPVADARCPDCSLIDACMPFAIVRLANPSVVQ